MKLVFFITLLVGIAAASCDSRKCAAGAGADVGALGKCQAAGSTLKDDLAKATTKEAMNEAYAKFCDGKDKCNEKLKKLLSQGIDCDCLFQQNRISTLTINQICEKNTDGDYFGTRLLLSLTTPRQCSSLDEGSCGKNPNCMYVSAVKTCAFKPRVDNLNNMCTAEVMEYLRMNPTGGAFSGASDTPALLAVSLTFCLKQADQYCVLSDSELPLTMTKENLTSVCSDSKKLACARSRLATVAASFRVDAIIKKLNNSDDSEVTQGYVVANSLDHAAQDLCVRNGEDYCLVGASTLVKSKCYPNCSKNGETCTEDEKKASKTILDSCCGATIKKDNLLLSGGIPQTSPMSVLYPSSPLRLNVPTAGDYDAAKLLQKGDAAATEASNKSIDGFATCVSGNIPEKGCVTTETVELGELIATIPFSLNDKLKKMLPFFIKSDLAIQLAVPYYTLSLSEPEKSDDVMFYLDDATEMTAGMKYTISITAEKTLADAAKAKFSDLKDKLHFFLTGAFLSNNGNGKSVSGVYPLLLTKEEKQKIDTGNQDGSANTNTSSENSETTLGVVSESTVLLAFVTVMAALFAM